MLSFNNLGNLGRLGNQMFQYASMKGIAKNNNLEITIPPKRFFGEADKNVKSSDGTIYDFFFLKNYNIGLQNNRQRTEKTFGFDEDLFNNCLDNTDLVGYFQNEKYFKNIEDEIRNEFRFKEDTVAPCVDFISQLSPTGEVISLHIRRGDYTTNPNHPTQPLKYYEDALSYLPNFEVIVFSDDPDWCHQQEIFSDDRFIVAEGNSTDADLCLMSLCRYHIIANSSFSWWGSYLAKSEKTIAPKMWFSDELAKSKDSSQIYREGWIVL
jgi:hypothetical protein